MQRYKESADEYRYFPEPDLPVLEVSRAWVYDVRRRLPELTDAKRDRFMSEFGLTRYDASQLVAEQAVAHYYDETIAAGANAKTTANLMLGSLFGLMNRDGIEREAIASTKISPQQFAALETRLGYRFRDRGLLEHALTHKSKAHEDPSGGVIDNESLEFLGDAVLGLVVADALFRTFPEFSEGQKSKIKATN